ncbi:hypothetical protein LZ30DRAFT_690160 [Colletotrichum cereale]|nr:hypothetical protein LZ30DRAFT_690160 [Colletotrichum cereale]
MQIPTLPTHCQGDIDALGFFSWFSGGNTVAPRQPTEERRQSKQFDLSKSGPRSRPLARAHKKPVRNHPNSTALKNSESLALLSVDGRNAVSRKQVSRTHCSGSNARSSFEPVLREMRRSLSWWFLLQMPLRVRDAICTSVRCLWLSTTEGKTHALQHGRVAEFPHVEVMPELGIPGPWRFILDNLDPEGRNVGPVRANLPTDGRRDPRWHNCRLDAGAVLR